MDSKELDEIAMRLARARANGPKAGGQRVAAALVTRQGAILGQGWNSYKTHPVMARAVATDWGGSLHAEVAALVNAAPRMWDRREMWQEELFGHATLVVARVVRTPDGSWWTAKAEPCRYCKMVIAELRVKNVWWSKDGVRVV